MPESDQWATVHVQLPFAEVNDMLGVQLDRSIVQCVQRYGTACGSLVADY